MNPIEVFQLIRVTIDDRIVACPVVIIVKI
jgi:hypothetical protein